MLDVSNWITLIALGALLLAPVLYGLATLSGMREKWLYPLLRLRSRDGRVATVVADERHDAQGHLGESSPPLHLNRHLFKSTR